MQFNQIFAQFFGEYSYVATQSDPRLGFLEM